MNDEGYEKLTVLTAIQLLLESRQHLQREGLAPLPDVQEL